MRRTLIALSICAALSSAACAHRVPVPSVPSRRVVTGFDASGKSVITWDGSVPEREQTRWSEASLARMPLLYALTRLILVEFFILGIALLSLLSPAHVPIFLAAVIKSNLCVFAMLLLTWTTPFHDILRELRRLRLPAVSIAWGRWAIGMAAAVDVTLTQLVTLLQPSVVGYSRSQPLLTRS